MAWLTKSRFMSGLQCHKRLWFEINRPLEEVVAPSTVMVQGRAFDKAIEDETVSDTENDSLGKIQPLYVVQERDIDLLLLEEPNSSPDFVRWFGQRVGLREAEFNGVWHSVSNSDGESDLLLRVLVGIARVGVYIEDKIAASEQPDQDERYHRRGVQGVKDNWFDSYVTCICAPRAYLGSLGPNLRLPLSPHG